MSHVILQGDCLTHLPTLPSDSVDLVITDPPFNIGKKYNTYKDNMSHDEYIKWCYKWLLECVRVMKPGASLYLFNYAENNAYMVPFLDKHLKFKRWLTWHYNNNMGGPQKNYIRSQTSILFYCKGEEVNTWNNDDICVPYSHHNKSQNKKMLLKGRKGRKPYDVQFRELIRHSEGRSDHPCQIPIDLLEMLIKASSNKGDTILDPFGGSLSTAVAAKRLGRNSINIEVDQHYCNVGQERLNNTSPTATLETMFSDPA